MWPIIQLSAVTVKTTLTVLVNRLKETHTHTYESATNMQLKIAGIPIPPFPATYVLLAPATFKKKNAVPIIMKPKQMHLKTV